MADKITKSSKSPPLPTSASGKKAILEKISSTDSSISMTFDSSSDMGYKSTDITSENIVFRGTQSTSRTISDARHNKKESNLFDSGLEFDVFSPLPSSSDIPCIPSAEASSKHDENQKQLGSRSALDWHHVYDQDDEGDTLLHIAVVEALSDVIFPMIQHAPHPDFLDICNILRQTPLHLASLMRKPNIARRLVVAGATLDLQDRYGNTALHISSKNGDVDTVRSLLQPLLPEEVQQAQCPYDVFPEYQDLSTFINVKNHDGQSSIHLAAVGGFKKVLECLCDLGGDVDDQERKSGKTALHYAVEIGNFEIVQFLVSKCHAEVEMPNFAGQTSLHFAWSLYREIRDSVRKAIFEYLKKHSHEAFESPAESSNGDYD